MSSTVDFNQVLDLARQLPDDSQRRLAESLLSLAKPRGKIPACYAGFVSDENAPKRTPEETENFLLNYPVPTEEEIREADEAMKWAREWRHPPY